MSRVFVDSSVIIESFKGNEKAVKLLRSLKDCDLAINPIVFSEVVYISMRYGKNLDKVFEFLDSFIMLDLTKEVVRVAKEYIVKEYIVKFKLLPNDSLILATCKHYGFSLASLDSNFKECCKAEGVKLLGVK